MRLRVKREVIIHDGIVIFDHKWTNGSIWGGAKVCGY